ncbi:hypothetical protein [Roseobacter sp. TSBP12]|uniref:hypothetical protein n=1 Tax=Roseobacter sp. TSBP12 TaxID=1236613 RepID=UPI00125F1985|nr:hypothetical protein [Roseobacter sp. TSBP12]KAB6714295.1 hypothetical protein C8029_21385 [Roseobacter sp. TSBP12]
MTDDKIMYVCADCGEHMPEACGHYDRYYLAVMPDGTWLCENCTSETDILSRCGVQPGGPDGDEWPRFHDFPHPPEYQPVMLSAAVHDALAERRRQIEVEGFSEDRDDKYVDGELASAALCYVMSAAHALTPQNSDKIEDLPEWWPVSWDEAFFKPTTARRDMIKAIALLLAQIESLDRAEENAVQL